MEGYEREAQIKDVRLVAGERERGLRELSPEGAAAARRLERLSALRVIDLVVDVERMGVGLGLRPEPVVEVLSPDVERQFSEARLR